MASQVEPAMGRWVAAATRTRNPKLLERFGGMIRATGDIVALSPPLIVEKTHIDQMFGQIGDALASID
jgi:adenosylmethionine-8-amino-7-oxononanoate aminotransferase